MNDFAMMLVGVGAIAGLAIPVLLIVRFFGERAQRLAARTRGADEPTLADITLPPPPQSWNGKMDQAFATVVQRAGTPMNSGQALGLMCFCGVLLGGALMIWRTELWLGAVGLLLGILIPFVVLLFLQARWARRYQEQLPDALFLMARSLRAGLSLEQAIHTVARNGAKPLAEEFHHVDEQINLGLSVPTALQRMADRLQIADFHALVSVVMLNRNLGGNLPELLDQLAVSTRDRIQFQAYFRAATALGRLTGLALALIAPAIFIGYFIWQPEYIIGFAESSAGLVGLSVALMLEIIGICWLWYLLRIDY
jgi:tight adherence protein B